MEQDNVYATGAEWYRELVKAKATVSGKSIQAIVPADCSDPRSMRAFLEDGVTPITGKDAEWVLYQNDLVVRFGEGLAKKLEMPSAPSRAVQDQSSPVSAAMTFFVLATQRYIIAHPEA